MKGPFFETLVGKDEAPVLVLKANKIRQIVGKGAKSFLTMLQIFFNLLSLICVFNLASPYGLARMKTVVKVNSTTIKKTNLIGLEH